MRFHHKNRLWAGLLTLSLLLSGCGYEQLGVHPALGETAESFCSPGSEYPSSGTGPPEDLPSDFEAFCLDVFRMEMEECSTLDLHYTLLHPERYGIQTGEATLGSYHLSDMVENNRTLAHLRSELLKYDRNNLEQEQKVTYDALLETLNTQLLAEGLELYDQPLAPTIGVQAQLPILLAEYSFHSLDDVNDYLALVEQIDEYYGEILVFEQQKADAGLAPSDASIDAIIRSCESYLENFAQTDSPDFLSETFLSRLNDLQKTVSLTENQITELIHRHALAISDHFIPAYEHLIRGMEAIKGRGIHDGGLCGLENGKEYYEYLVKSGSGVSYSVPELKAALTAQMKQNMADMSILSMKYPDLDGRIASAVCSLTDPLAILEDLNTQMAADFPKLPDCDYEVRYVPASLEESLSPAFYLTAPLDDTDQNVIYINNAYKDSGTGLYTTLAHEGFPGHLYQTVYSRSQTLYSPLRAILSCSGANEGWATYVEHLAHDFDHGLPEGVGRYYALLRSYSLCVHGLLDIGIHYEGWDKEASDSFVSSCFQVDQATLDELWQVIIDNPTNYLDYCGGFVELLEMREDAELALGNDFSVMEFHRFLLDIGPLPFSVIRAHFREWLNGQI